MKAMKITSIVKLSLIFMVLSALPGSTVPVLADELCRDVTSDKECDSALEMLNGLITPSCLDPMAYELRGDIYARMGLSDEARQEYLIARKLERAEMPAMSLWCH